ncbi:hypothetical protein ColTof4_13834 [Colletotrichum tofieldiae]|nr:hypothetical protein ColTof3_01713 [Colletotrichum tofieldiae]GKT81411.1 hypothetical protein ColTof4_13834 [Colletotrichum tofieldiae]
MASLERRRQIRFRLCTECQSTAYCSVECQQTDWRPHRLLCKQFRRMGPRPSPSHHLVVYFPMEVDRPTLAWGNLLRGRPTNPYILHVYFLDDLGIRNLVTNKALHGTVPPLVGDTWGETI